MADPASPPADPASPSADPAPPPANAPNADRASPTEGARKLQHGTVDGGADTARRGENGEVVPRPDADGAELDHAVRETPVHPADAPDERQ